MLLASVADIGPINVPDVKSGLVVLYQLLVVSSNIMFVKLLHCSKARPPIEVTLSGIVMLSRLEQSSKVLFPIVVTLFGIVILSRLVQP